MSNSTHFTVNLPGHDASRSPSHSDDLPLSAIVGALLAHRHMFTDIHLESDQPVMLRQSAGDWVPATDQCSRPIVVSHARIMAYLNAVYGGEEKVRPPQAPIPKWEAALNSTGSLHTATVLSDSEHPDDSPYRVRCTVLKQGMGRALGLVIRALQEVPESIESLGLPIQVNRLIANSTNGLIVVTGPTGSGKSTTMAAMIDDINRTRANNILTIEDPIEYEFDRRRSMINQRELHVDVPSFNDGVRDALRYAPDVIMVGETRDADTMRAALRAAESGHLVLTSMHAPTAVTALRKMVAYLDGSADVQALAGCLVGVVAQALIRCMTDNRANALAYEVLNGRDPAVQSAIATFRPGNDALTDVEKRLRLSQIEGSVPFINSLRQLVSKRVIDPRRAASIVQTPEDRAEFLRQAQVNYQ